METKPALQARVLIVDDQPMIRTALRVLLDRQFDVCGDAVDGKDAIAKVIQLNPDIVVLDIGMPRMNGIDAAHEIRRISPATKILFLTLHDTSTYEKRTCSLGPLLPKTAAATELIPALMGLVDCKGVTES